MLRQILALLVLTSCGAYIAPSGERIVTVLDHERVAARRAAAQDIPCEAGKVAVVTWLAPRNSSKGDLMVVEGCGQRLSYVCDEDEHCELFARLQRSP
jgi:hypothetical protein